MCTADWKWPIMCTADWEWLIMCTADWEWLVMFTADWHWLIMCTADWKWLIMCTADWKWLIMCNSEVLQDVPMNHFTFLVVLGMQWHWAKCRMVACSVPDGPEGYHRRKHTQEPRICMPIKGCWLICFAGYHSFADVRKRYSRDRSVSFDMNLFFIKMHFSCTRKGLVNQRNLWLNVCVSFACLRELSSNGCWVGRG